jgi:glycerol kinase
MSEYVLAVDAGTTRIRALVVDGDRIVVARAHTDADISHPAPGRVEQDPERLWAATRHVIDTTLAAAKIPPENVAAIGIAAQRGNVIVWDKDTGRAVSPLVSWQDLRGTTRTAELLAEGFLLSHQMSAAKLESVLAGIDRGFDRLNSGQLLWGNLDTYLAWRLSGGTVYATDHGQACATGYYDYLTGQWNAPLIQCQRLDPARFPALVDSIGQIGISAENRWPIGAILADQQSAAIAQDCSSNGLHKVSYGTSATLDANTGSAMLLAPGCYPMVLYQRGGARTFCIEGMVNTAGAMIDWVVAELGLAATPETLSELASSVDDCGGVFTLPALQGLGAPHGDAARTAMVGGLSRATTRAHIARAVFEGIAFRIREVWSAVRSVPDVQLANHLRADGGASRSDVMMQIQADVLGIPVERLAISEATALGAAIGAGCTVNLWELQTPAHRRIDRTFLPRWSDDEREGRYATWRQRCGLTATST